MTVERALDAVDMSLGVDSPDAAAAEAAAAASGESTPRDISTASSARSTVTSPRPAPLFHQYLII